MRCCYCVNKLFLYYLTQSGLAFTTIALGVGWNLYLCDHIIDKFKPSHVHIDVGAKVCGMSLLLGSDLLNKKTTGDKSTAKAMENTGTHPKRKGSVNI